MSWTPGSFDPDPGALLNIASGVLLVGLSVFVASVKPRRRANLAFAGFAGGWGLSIIADWLFDPGRGVLPATPGSALHLAFQLAGLLFLGAALVLLPMVALLFPQRPAQRELMAVRLASLGAVLLAVVSLGLWVAAEGWTSRMPAASGYPLLAGLALMALDLLEVAGRFTAFLFALLLLALRAGIAHQEGRHAERRQLVLMTVALALHAGALNGIWASAMDLRRYPGAVMVPAFVGLCTVAASWLSQTRFGPSRAAHAARNMAFLILGLPVVAWILYTLLKTYVVPDGSPGLGGATGTLAVLVLAYAILRHQLLGTDVKLRWTISRGTVAAAFITVFFIASEGAQILFGAENEWLGLVAAGGLVFAIAPLQRAAERLAEKAVPSSATLVPPGAPTEVRKNPEEVFRKVLGMAVRDGRLSADERVHLAEVAEAFGLSAGRAAALVRDAERDPEVTE